MNLNFMLSQDNTKFGKLSSPPLLLSADSLDVKTTNRGLSIEFRNEPFSWDANSLQDTALLILLNLAVISSVRSTLRAELAIPIIFQIAQYSSNTVKTRSITSHEECQMNFQCIKAVSNI